MDLALYRRGFKLPTGRNRLLGAGKIHFKAFFHWVTSWIEVEWLVGIAAVDKIKENPLCQEKSGFWGLVIMAVLGLKNENNMVRISRYLSAPPGKDYVHHP
jgi:hypothetical protein